MRFCIITILIILVSCSHQSSEPENPAYTYLKNKNFVITNFTIDLIDETELFSDYVFAFKSNNTVDVIGSDNSVSGSWSVFYITLEGQFLSYNNFKMHLNNSDAQFQKLNDEFIISLSSPNEMAMYSTSKNLRFTKID